MRVPEEIRKCVLYLGYRTYDGKDHILGTAFVVYRYVASLGIMWRYVVTAGHNIDNIKKKGLDRVVIRANFTDGMAQPILSNVDDWYYHPNDPSVDVAVIQVALFEDMDHLGFPVNGFATEENMRVWDVGVGDEVFICGLFYKHQGKQRNLPIVRIGNIAAILEEPVPTRRGPELMDAYLIEVRSMGGLSGSPVFVHLGYERWVDGNLHPISNRPFLLLGLMHGHFEAPVPDIDQVVEDGVQADRMNLGIGVVVPATKILEVISHPIMQAREKEMEDRLRREQAPLDATE